MDVTADIDDNKQRLVVGYLVRLGQIQDGFPIARHINKYRILDIRKAKAIDSLNIKLYRIRNLYRFSIDGYYSHLADLTLTFCTFGRIYAE